MPKPKKPTPAELRSVAEQRAPARSDTEPADETYGVLASSKFARGRGGPRTVGNSRTHTISPVRVTASMADALASYGNTNNLTPSAAVRALLGEALGLTEEEPA